MEAHGGRIRLDVRHVFNQRADRTVDKRRAPVPGARDQGLMGSRREQVQTGRQFAARKTRQNLAEIRGIQAYGSLLIQRGGIFENKVPARAVFHGLEREGQLCAVRRHGAALDRRAGKGHAGGVRPQREQYAVERVFAHTARQFQRPDEVLGRNVAAVEQGGHAFAHGGKIVFRRTLHRQAQRQRGDQRTADGGKRRAAAHGYRCAHREVAPSGKPCNENAERRKEQHKRREVLARRQLRAGTAVGFVQGEVILLPAEIKGFGPNLVGRNQDRLGHGGEHGFQGVQLCARRTACGGIHRIIAEGQRRRLRRFARAERIQLLQQQRDAQTVADQMVLVQKEPAHAVRILPDGRAQERGGIQPEGTQKRGAGRVVIRRVNAAKRQGHRFGIAAHGASAGEMEGGAQQRFMLRQRGKRGAQARQRKLRRQTQNGRHMIGDPRGIGKGLCINGGLGRRKGILRLLGGTRDCGGCAARRVRLPVDTGGKRRRGAAEVEIGHAQAQAKAFLQQGQGLHGV